MHEGRNIALRKWISFVFHGKKSWHSGIFLAFISCLGWIIGSAIARHIGGDHAVLMMQASCIPVTLIGALVSAWLPFVLGTAAVRFVAPELLYGLCFLDSLLFAVGCHSISVAFGSAGWLIRLLLLFTDLFTLPLLLWFSYACLTRRRLHGSFACFVLSAAVGCVDYCFVSPFLAMLIEI